MTCNPSNLAFFFTTLKKQREKKKGASHCGNTKWSPAELRQSGNPWQCDFCLLLCIKSRCQEPSLPQPWLNPPCTSLPLFLWPWRRWMITSTAASKQMWPERKGEVLVKQKIYTTPWHVESLCTWNHSWNESWSNVCSKNNFKYLYIMKNGPADFLCCTHQQNEANVMLNKNMQRQLLGQF